MVFVNTRDYSRPSFRLPRSVKQPKAFRNPHRYPSRELSSSDSNCRRFRHRLQCMKVFGSTLCQSLALFDRGFKREAVNNEGVLEPIETSSELIGFRAKTPIMIAQMQKLGPRHVAMKKTPVKKVFPQLRISGEGEKNRVPAKGLNSPSETAHKQPKKTEESNFTVKLSKEYPISQQIKGDEGFLQLIRSIGTLPPHHVFVIPTTGNSIVVKDAFEARLDRPSCLVLSRQQSEKFLQVATNWISNKIGEGHRTTTCFIVGDMNNVNVKIFDSKGQMVFSQLLEVIPTDCTQSDLHAFFASTIWQNAKRHPEQAAFRLVEFLRSRGVVHIVSDFDLTLVDQHTYGAHYPGRPWPRIMPDFIELAKEAQRNGMKIHVATYADKKMPKENSKVAKFLLPDELKNLTPNQIRNAKPAGAELVKATLKKHLESLGKAKTPEFQIHQIVAYFPKYHGEDPCTVRKDKHLEKIKNNLKPKPRNNQMVLIDDDSMNVCSAAKKGHFALHVSKRQGFQFDDLQACPVS